MGDTVPSAGWQYKYANLKYFASAHVYKCNKKCKNYIGYKNNIHIRSQNNTNLKDKQTRTLQCDTNICNMILSEM